MRLNIDGHSLPVKNLDSARLRDVAELQQQTGWTLTEIRQTTRGKAAIPERPAADGKPAVPAEPAVPGNEALNAAVLIFLTLRAAGIPTTWDEVQDRALDDIQIVQDPGDLRHQEPETADPSQPSGDSSPDAGDQGEGQDQPAK